MKIRNLYIHIPFCIRKCQYCDFLSFIAAEETKAQYMEQLCREVAAGAKRYPGCKAASVFIGGGTPSVLPAGWITRLMEQVRSSFCLLPGAEITIECNPGTLDEEKLREYRASGINRLSMGLQSADPEELELLGRVHTFGQFRDNYQMAREIGFDNINVDVMSALPGQKPVTYEKTIRKVLDLRPEHISAYSLMIEEGTPFFDRYRQAELAREKGRYQELLPTEEEERQMYRMTKELLKNAGYSRYEISNYSLEGSCCRHNIGYWKRTEYLGLGLGAASLIGDTRFRNTADLEGYLAFDFLDSRYHTDTDRGWHIDCEQLDRQAQMEEFMFLGMRMMAGVGRAAFRQQFGTDIEDIYGQILKEQSEQGLIKETEQGYCLTEFGIDVSNHVLAGYLL